MNARTGAATPQPSRAAPVRPLPPGREPTSTEIGSLASCRIKINVGCQVLVQRPGRIRGGTRRRWSMPFVPSNDGTEIYYKGWGSGQPIVFSHGWPLSGDDWDTQMLFFLQQGYRVIAHDRRGHG